MAFVAQFLNPRLLVRISERELDSVVAAIDAEVLTNPEVRKALEGKASVLARELEAKHKG
jgi:hypothetical protein